MRGIGRVQAAVAIGLAILIAVGVVVSARELAHRSKGSGATRLVTYTFGNLGFALTYDAQALKVERDTERASDFYGPVYFVSRQGPQNSRSIPSSEDMAEVRVVRLDNLGAAHQPADLIREWLAIRPFGATVDVRVPCDDPERHAGRHIRSEAARHEDSVVPALFPWPRGPHFSSGNTKCVGADVARLEGCSRINQGDPLDLRLAARSFVGCIVSHIVGQRDSQWISATRSLDCPERLRTERGSGD